MIPTTGRRSPPLAALLITIALMFLPVAQRSRYRSEWMAELDEMGRLHIAQTLPALRILISAPAVGRVLGTTSRRRISLPIGQRISRDIGDRLFAENDVQGYWWGWQITKLAGGLGRQYRDPRFENPLKPGQGGLPWSAGPTGGPPPDPGLGRRLSGHYSSRVWHGPACLRKDRLRRCRG